MGLFQFPLAFLTLPLDPRRDAAPDPSGTHPDSSTMEVRRFMTELTEAMNSQNADQVQSRYRESKEFVYLGCIDPMFGWEPFSRVATVSVVLGLRLIVHTAPLFLPRDYSFDPIPLVEPVCEWRFLILVFAVAVAAWVSAKRGRGTRVAHLAVVRMVATAVRGDEGHGDRLADLGVIHIAEGDRDTGVGYLERAVQAKPSPANAWYDPARTRLARGERALARTALDRVLENADERRVRQRVWAGQPIRGLERRWLDPLRPGPKPVSAFRRSQHPGTVLATD